MSAARKRQRREYENPDYAAFIARSIRSLGRRLGDGDVESIVLIANLEAELDRVKFDAITGLRDFGYSWAEIAQRMGTSKQNVQQWHSRRDRVAPVIPIGGDA